jgi:hypothetical protein
MSQHSPIDFQVPDGRNIIAHNLLTGGYEWLLFIDHDVIVPPNLFLLVNDVMAEKKYPIWAGIYFTKSVPSEPLIYRGRGNGYFRDWKFGDKVWVDGVHMGCTLIHRSVFEGLAPNCRRYVPAPGMPEIAEFYINPAKVFSDPEQRATFVATGTEDLNFCERVIEQGVIQKAGWEVPDFKHPIMIDTSVYCRHIDQNGLQYPSLGEDAPFMEVDNGSCQLETGKEPEVKDELGISSVLSSDCGA